MTARDRTGEPVQPTLDNPPEEPDDHETTRDAAHQAIDEMRRKLHNPT